MISTPDPIHGCRELPETSSDTGKPVRVCRTLGRTRRTPVLQSRGAGWLHDQLPRWQMTSLYYSTHTPPAEIERLTSYDFSCFTRFDPCADLEDLFPVAKDWHLYNEDPLKLRLLARKTLRRSCLGIGARRPLCSGRRGYSPRGKQVRIIESLKQPPPWPIGAIVSAHTFDGYNYPPAEEDAEYLIPGKRFIVFPVGDDERHQLLTRDSPINLERCGVQQDTPEIRRDLEKGFAQNDTLNP